MSASPQIARDLERHFADELLAFVDRHTAIMAQAMEPAEIIIAMMKAGDTLHLSAMATTIANRRDDADGSAEELLAIMRKRVADVLEREVGTIIAKAAAARVQKGGR